MSADVCDFDPVANEDHEPFMGLQGVDELINSDALEILRQRVDTSGLRAMLRLAGLVAEHDAQIKDAA